MPESAGPERRREVERVLERLSRAVDAVGEQVEGMPRGAAGNAEPDGGFEERLGALEDENRQLRETLVRAKRKAERLRTRLALVEDEV
ncbi:hypothetical protein [Candidatus Palauibacter sp.]|uniref:hypothetical protein n=1 Tax=Candidatus Palauibacter sp. TaxID=3101350 RepID=UPI003B0134F2